MAQQDPWSSSTIDRSMAGAKGVGNIDDLRDITGGWGELLKCWPLLVGVFLLPVFFGAPIILMLVIFYIGIGFTAKGMLAKLIISIGKNFNTAGKNYGGSKTAKDHSKALIQQSDAQAMAISAFSNELSAAQILQDSSDEFIKSSLANQEDIIDRDSAQNDVANILTWGLYFTLIGFSGLLIYAGYNPEFFKPVAWIRHPVQAIYYGAMGLAIVLPLFIYFSFMGARKR